MDIIVTGAAGRLGGAIVAEVAAAGHNVTALGRSDLDVANSDQVSAAIERLQPQVIVNCSAYNAVDDAERNQKKAFDVNAQGPSILAAAARRTSALLVHFSSDFVFDGTAVEPYAEDALPNPLSVYGASKLAGEIEARRAGRHYVLRVESNFGGLCPAGRRATVDHITDNIFGGMPVRAFADRTVSPSYVADVARATRALIEYGAPYGTYHCVNSGYTTWYELAVEIARQMGVRSRITPTMSTDVVTAAPRPRFCALSNRKLCALRIEMPTWQSAIERYLFARDMLAPTAVQRAG